MSINRYFFIVLLILPCFLSAVMTDKEFFNSLNLDYPGLQQVDSALVSGDTSLAKEELLSYYQTRTHVKYLNLSGSGSLSDATRNLNQEFEVIGIWQNCSDDDGTLIDWMKTSSDDEWHYQFHRMYFLPNLGKVYGSNGNEIYAVGWADILLDWIAELNPGYPRTLDVGIRLRNIVYSYQYIINKYTSSSISAMDHVTILKSLMEQCRYLRDYWRDKGNWGASETRGLGAVVTMFPEFKFTEDTSWEWWRDLVISRLDHHLSNDFSSDGVQFETSPSYHSIEYRELFLTYTLLDLNEIIVPGDLSALFIKPLEFMMHIHKPNKYMPQLSDTDKISYLSCMEDGADLFGRQDMKYAATCGKEGVPPSTFAAFPDGGYFVMRSDWGENQNDYDDTRYLVFDTGTDNTPWHAHYDMLNFEAYAYGKTIVIDPGRYAYTNRRLEYYKNTIAHNTIVIDNKNQQETANGAVSWNSLYGFNFVDASHDAYSGLQHRRSIFFVKPDYWIVSDLITGSGSHIYDLYFHLEPYYDNHTNLNIADNTVATPNFLIIPSEPDAAAELIDGWVSYSYASEDNAPVVKYTKQGEAPVTFETVIYPFSGPDENVTISKMVVYNGWGWDLFFEEAFALQISRLNRTDYFCMNYVGDDSLEFAGFGFKGQVAFISQDGTGTIDNIELVQGSKLFKTDTLLTNTFGVDANISLSDKKLTLSAENLANFIVWAPDVESVLVNGKSVQFVQDGDYVIGDATVAINSEDISTANNFALQQNYPNPFNPSTTIVFDLAKTGKVRLEIYNVLGQQVDVLEEGQMSAGAHKIVWNAQTFTTGVYFYKLSINNMVKVRKMILLK